MGFISKRARPFPVTSMLSFHPLRTLPELLSSNIIWLGDANYRLDLDNETARALVDADDFDALLAADQVFNHSSSLHVYINQE